MKKSISLVTLSLFIASSSMAGQSCSDQLDLVIKEKSQQVDNDLSLQKKDGSKRFEGSKVVAVWGGSVVLGSVAASGGAALVAWFGYMGKVGMDVLSRNHAQNMRDLFQQAADVAGGADGKRSIRKLYKRYLRTFKGAKSDKPPFSLKDFAQAIHTADLNGNACKQEVIPERGDVLRLSLEENLEASAPTVTETDNGADKNMNGIPDQLEGKH